MSAVEQAANKIFTLLGDASAGKHNNATLFEERGPSVVVLSGGADALRLYVVCSANVSGAVVFLFLSFRLACEL